MLRLNYQPSINYSKRLSLNKTIKRKKTSLEKINLNQFVNPNGERIKISITDLPIKERNWSTNEIDLLNKFFKLNFTTVDALFHLPTRNQEQIRSRASSWSQYEHLFDIVKTSIFEKNLKEKRKLIKVKLTNNSEFNINSFDLPTKDANIKNVMKELIINYYNNDKLKYNLSHILPIYNRFQINNFHKHVKNKINLPILSQKYTNTSAFDLPTKTNPLSILEKEYLELAIKLGTGFEHLISLMPTRSISFISMQRKHTLESYQYKYNHTPLSVETFKYYHKKTEAPNKTVVSVNHFDLPLRMGRFGSMELELFKKAISHLLSLKEITQSMPLRGLKQIQSKAFSLEMSRVQGPWLSSERKKLVEAIQPYIKNGPNGSNGYISDEIPWSIIAHEVRTRTPIQCRYQWNCVLNPDIIKYRPFTKEEDHIILNYDQLIPDKKLKKLLPGRTSMQTRSRYYQLKSDINKDWSESELNALYEAIYIYGPLDWNKVSGYVKSRSSWQCSTKWIANRYPNNIKEETSKEIQAINFRLVERLNRLLHRRPKLISLLVPGLSYNQVIYYSRKQIIAENHLRYKRDWTSEETANLIELFLEHGMQWELIAREISELTGVQACGEDCKYKIKTMTQTKYTRIQNNILKDAIIGKYQEEKAKGLLYPKFRSYILDNSKDLAT